MVDAIREVNPNANLLYNDFNIWNKDCEALLEELRYMGVELRAWGFKAICTHSYGPWKKPGKSASGTPVSAGLHFTELTVLSGNYIGRNGMMSDDSKPEDWYRGKEMEELQAKYALTFYTMLFSHPR